MDRKLLTLGLALAGTAAQAQERPNIVLFLVDDMGVMDTSVPFLTDGKGNPVRYPLNDWYRTPSMERLASQGVRFSQFYAQGVSSPSRTSLLTGQDAARHRVTNWIRSEEKNRDDYGPYDWNWEGLGAADITLPRLLQQAGYRTIHVGKGHFAPFGHDGEDPLNLGFDINIAGFKAKSVSGRILTSKNAADYNDFQHPNVVAPKEFKDAKLSKKGVLTVKVPAKSVVVLNIK